MSNYWSSVNHGLPFSFKYVHAQQCDQIKIAKGLKKLPKVQKIAQSGHTDAQPFEGLAIQFFNGTLTASFSFFFSLFKQPLYNFYNNMM